MAIDLSESRKKIDDIDAQIVRLFEERMNIASDVADYKVKTGKAVYDREREKQKLDTLKKLTHNDFNRLAVAELYEQIMSISRKYQYRLINEVFPDSEEVSDFKKTASIGFSEGGIIYFFGVRGSYTQAAMEEVFGTDIESHHSSTFRGVMEAVADGRADFGVLPIENSSTGGVTANYDSILEYPNSIVGEHVMNIRQCLVGLSDTDINDIHTVYSHSQGLMQCRDFIESHPGMKAMESASTSAAARMVAEKKDHHIAAIAGAMAAKEYGLSVLKSDIQTADNNSTRFIIISNKKLYTADSNKLSLCFELPHTSGSLYRILSHFLFNNLNLTLIESRPIPGRQWEYRFFVDVDGNLDDPAIKNALRGIHEEAAYFRILGNYTSISA